MAKFKCKVCGYIHEGNKAPDVCPVCMAPASEFEEVKEPGAAGKKGLNRDSKSQVQRGDQGGLPDQCQW